MTGSRTPGFTSSLLSWRGRRVSSTLWFMQRPIDNIEQPTRICWTCVKTTPLLNEPLGVAGRWDNLQTHLTILRNGALRISLLIYELNAFWELLMWGGGGGLLVNAVYQLLYKLIVNAIDKNKINGLVMRSYTWSSVKCVGTNLNTSWKNARQRI